MLEVWGLQICTRRHERGARAAGSHTLPPRCWPLAPAAAPGLTGGRAENCPTWCQSGRKVPANATAAEGDGTKDSEMLKPLNLVQGKWALAVGELRARCHLLSCARELGSLPTQAPLPHPRSSSGQQLAAGSKGSRCQGDVLPISVRFWLGVDVLLSPHQPCPSWREQGETRSICQRAAPLAG